VRRIGTAVAVAALACAPACRESGRPDPDIRMAISHEPAEETASAAQPGNEAIPTRLEVPPAVVEAYTGIRLRWTDASTGKEGVIEVPLGGATPLPDPSLVVRADVFLPAFTMGRGAITSDGVEEQNPAAKITVFEKDKAVFGGWIFTRFPDVHPFTHPRFHLRLEGGVRRAAK
jgi:hypothetical protein